MKTALVLLLSFGAALFAADQPQSAAKVPGGDQKQPEQVKKLGTVTWDPEAHKLIWAVQKGKMVNGEFVRSSEEKYEISPDEATMANSDEKRGFTEDEATTLHHLLDVLSLYCAESVVWWDQGEGTPVEPGAAPANPHSPQRGTKPSVAPGEKPVKVREPQPNKPVFHVPDDALIAALVPVR